jgi:hypothetical protein
MTAEEALTTALTALQAENDRLRTENAGLRETIATIAPQPSRLNQLAMTLADVRDMVASLLPGGLPPVPPRVAYTSREESVGNGMPPPPDEHWWPVDTGPTLPPTMSEPQPTQATIPDDTPWSDNEELPR